MALRGTNGYLWLAVDGKKPRHNTGARVWSYPSTIHAARAARENVFAHCRPNGLYPILGQRPRMGRRATLACLAKTA